MKRDFPDYHAVRPEHEAIHLSLLNWARLVRVNAIHQAPSPMFQHYRSSEIWVADTSIPINTLEGWDMEKEVKKLPEKHRAAVRWHYVYTKRPPGKQARLLAVPMSVLHDLVHDGRSMLKNRC